MKASYAYVLAPILGYLIAQVTKDILGRRNIRSWKEWFRSGSMPSSHTAIVTALTSVIFFHEGVSPLLAVAGTFSVIIIHDALVARRSIGEIGLALRDILPKVKYDGPTPHVALGHKPMEAVAGAAIGIGVGFIVALFITI